jgi:hypothetical protein
MNFAFNNLISFGPDGSMTIQNGSQTIKMGQGGMVIQNQNGANVYMNSNGVQFFPNQTQYTSYSGPGFQVQTSFSTGPTYYQQQHYYDDSGEEMSSQNSSYEEQEYWHDNNVPQQHYSYQTSQGGNVNIGWQVHHQVNNYPQPNVYYYSPAQEQNMPPPQPKPKCLTKEQLNMLPVSTYTAKPVKTKSQSSKSKTKEKGNSKNDESNYVESCPICIVDYKTGDKVKTLPCLHKFHRECVDKWLLMKSDCPICKYDLLE